VDHPSERIAHKAQIIEQFAPRWQRVGRGGGNRLVVAYTLREQLTSIFDTARSTADGLRRIQLWRRRVDKRGLRCFDSFLKLLDTWLDLMANYFIDRHTNACVEGLNNKLQVLKRRCYGLRNVVRLFQRLTLDMEGYRRFSPWR